MKSMQLVNEFTIGKFIMSGFLLDSLLPELDSQLQVTLDFSLFLARVFSRRRQRHLSSLIAIIIIGV